MANITTSWTTIASKTYKTGSLSAKFLLQARVVSQSVANNSSVIQTRLRSEANTSSYGGYPYKFTCSYCTTKSGSSMWYIDTENILTSPNKTANHNSDGTKSLSLSATAVITGLGMNISLSGTATLPKINRLAIVSSGVDFVLDNGGGPNVVTNNPTIKFSNPANYQLQPYLEIYNGSTKVATITRTKGSYTSPYNFNLTQAERDNFLQNNTTAKQYNVREGITTYNGSSNIGSSYVTKKMDVVGHAEADYSYEDTNPTTIAITGDNQKIIQNQSTLQINLSNIVPYQNAPIVTAEAIYNSITYNGTISGDTATIPIGTIDSTSDVEVVARLIDTRGNIWFRYIPITILSWQIPTANITLQRQNNFYSETDIKVDANYSDLDGNNTISIKVRYKKTTDSTYGSYVTLQDNVTSTLTLDNLYEWDVQVLVEDRLGSTTYNLTLDKGMPIIYFDRLKRSVGINYFPQYDESLEVESKLYLNNQNIEDYIYDTGWQTITPTNGTAGTGYYVPQYRRVGKLVTMRGYITVKNNTAMFNLPEAYRPSARLTFAGTNDSLVVNEIRITEAGNVQLLRSTGTLSSGVSCFLDNISYFID